MTPAAVQELVQATPLPPGYELRVTAQRKFELRSLWNVRVFRDGDRVWGRAFYQVHIGISIAQQWAWTDSGVRA